MASLHIAEFSGLGSVDQSTDLQVFAPGANLANQVVALSASSAPSVAFQPTTRFVKLTAGGPCSIAFGPVGTVVAAVNGWFLASGESILVRVDPNDAKGTTGAANGTNGVAAITDTP